MLKAPGQLTRWLQAHIPDDYMTTQEHSRPEPLDVIVIGGGQAGLATGYSLAKKGLSYRILDRAARIGDSWRTRYDSLTLFTPRAFSQLPGLSLEGDPDGYASRDEFADYLERYAGRFELPVDLQADVMRLSS